MNTTWVQWAVSLLLPFLALFCTWIVVSNHKLKVELAELKLYVSENYAKKDSIDRVIEKLDHLGDMVNQIAGKLSVSA